MAECLECFEEDQMPICLGCGLCTDCAARSFVKVGSFCPACIYLVAAWTTKRMVGLEKDVDDFVIENYELRTRLMAALWGSDWSYWIYPGVCWVVPPAIDCIANHEANQ